MQPHTTCQTCHRVASGPLLAYAKGDAVLRNDSLLQCDICERFLCAECLHVYDIYSGYDFLCDLCAELFAPPRGARGH